MFNQLCDLIHRGAVILDVRSKREYKQDHNPQSINIPLDVLSREISRFACDQPIIVCCASGWRSQKAAQLLKRYGIKKVYNACSWQKTICSKGEGLIKA